MKKGCDYLLCELIDPDFYLVLKERGLGTARRPDGSYWDNDSQELWEEICYKNQKGNKNVTEKV